MFQKEIMSDMSFSRPLPDPGKIFPVSEKRREPK